MVGRETDTRTPEAFTQPERGEVRTYNSQKEEDRVNTITYVTEVGKEIFGNELEQQARSAFYITRLGRNLTDDEVLKYSSPFIIAAARNLALENENPQLRVLIGKFYLDTVQKGFKQKEQELNNASEITVYSRAEGQVIETVDTRSALEENKADVLGKMRATLDSFIHQELSVEERDDNEVFASILFKMGNNERNSLYNTLQRFGHERFLLRAREKLSSIR